VRLRLRSKGNGLLGACLLFYTAAFGQRVNGLEQLLGIPHVANLIASPDEPLLLFTANEKGQRNVYRAAGPNYVLERLTDYEQDDGLEITSLRLGHQVVWAVYVRGGDHGANSAARATNAASTIQPMPIELHGIHLPTGRQFRIDEGDFPSLHPKGKSVAYLKNSQVWIAELGESTVSTGRPLFRTRGAVRHLRWSPDGKKLAFTVVRGDYSFVGVYTDGYDRITWVGPSFNRDRFPVWSPDGRQLAFIRSPAVGGELDPLLVKRHQPWTIMVADTDGAGDVRKVWEAPLTLEGGVPSWPGNFNLHWPVPEQLTFLSYQDGWPHLYSVSPDGQWVKQLTEGDFSVDDISYSKDGGTILFAANTGGDKDDIDRKHIGMVTLQDGRFRMLTNGKGIESSPQLIGGEKSIAILSSTATRPVFPAVMSLEKPAMQRLITDSAWLPKVNGQLVAPTTVAFNAADGLTIRGQLFTPKHLRKDAPALVYIHGGPRRQMLLGWHHIDYYSYDYSVNQYLASKGFFVLAVNYRMGTGYGYDFQHPANAGTLGAAEYQDIVAAGRWLASLDGIDPQRIGVFGGSYGGYLTAMALGKDSELFKAGVDIHGVHNRKRKMNLEEYPPDFEEAAVIAWEASPSYWVDGWRSPVLIIHADDDQNVPFQQSIDLVNRLSKRQVQVETLVVPDDTHHWMRFDNLLRVKAATVEFLERHLAPAHE